MTDASKPVVLIVEDEVAQLELLAYNLNVENFRVLTATDGEEALLLAEEELPDLIILDWMLPKVSGIEVCRQLKQKANTKNIPIFMLTARSDESDLVRGLETGADDYLPKPYSLAELIARARALLRRTRPASMGETLQFADVTVNMQEHRVERDGVLVPLGPTEFRLLSTMMERPKRVWSRDLLLDRVWGRDKDVDLRTVDVHVGRLRKALSLEGKDDLIRTVRGAGYALDEQA